MSVKEFQEIEDKLRLDPQMVADAMGRKAGSVYASWRKPQTKERYEIILIGIYIKKSKLNIDELVSIIEPIKAIKNK
jgi:hypothetical protein